jgi:hypothetical protein
VALLLHYQQEHLAVPAAAAAGPAGLVPLLHLVLQCLLLLQQLLLLAMAALREALWVASAAAVTRADLG